MMKDNPSDRSPFTHELYEKLAQINPGIAQLEFFEFEYALESLVPENGWASCQIEEPPIVEEWIHSEVFFKSIQLNPRRNGKAAMDERIVELTRMLFAGLVSGAYSLEWITRCFYFDLRGFLFFARSEYFSQLARDRLGGKPAFRFAPLQEQFSASHAIGYQEFKAANQEIDACLLHLVSELVARTASPLLIALAGPTAAGKTEIVSRMRTSLIDAGLSITSVEMDHFFTDRDYREAHGIDSMGKEALHYELLLRCLRDLQKGERASTPRYDFIEATSSHDLQSKLKPGRSGIEIEPADIILMEGNYPFLLPEIAALINLKIVYLTRDDVRLKRKWRRDMDYRKKYELYYFLNRYFREQFLMARYAYIPQIECCDIAVDTTRAEIWLTGETKRQLACL